MWFEKLTGFREETPEQVRAHLLFEGTTITSNVNGKTWTCGTLEMPTLAMLREEAKGVHLRGKLTVREVVADVQALHADSEHARALFQVASQFNLLEMISPSVTPEAGIGIYEQDRTQGPACAIAAGAGTIYRNYFVPIAGGIGQSAAHQIDCLHEVGEALGNDTEGFWEMRNGYVLPTASGLQEVSERISNMPESERDALRAHLRIGIQWNTQVILPGVHHLVTQVYGSALPVAYARHPAVLWAPFAKLVLDASYEATLWTALLNLARNHNNRVYLTLLGGGAFGNRADWIISAIRRALVLLADRPLDVAIVSYGSSNPDVCRLIESISDTTG